MPPRQGTEPMMSTSVKPDADKLTEATDASHRPDVPGTTPFTFR